MTDKEKIRAEIEMLKESGCASPIVICDTLLAFIDSMPEEPVSEDLEKIVEEIAEPTILNAYGTKELARRLRNTICGTSVSEELEKAAESYSNNLDNICGSIGEQTRNAFKAGAHWQLDLLEKNRLTACDRASKEEIGREQDFCDKIIIGEHRQPTFSDAIEYGIKWQKEQDIKHGYVTFLQGEKHFANYILEMINNGWHIVAIKTACNDKIKED